MNQTTVSIAEYVATKYGPCDLKTARRIQTDMEESGLDFSECSKRVFHRAIDLSYRSVVRG